MCACLMLLSATGISTALISYAALECILDIIVTRFVAVQGKISPISIHSSQALYTRTVCK